MGVAAEAVASSIPSIVQKNVRDSYSSSCTWNTMGSSGQMWATCGSTFYRVDYFSKGSSGNWNFNGYRRVYPDNSYHFQQSLTCKATSASGTGCTRTPGRCADGTPCLTNAEPDEGEGAGFGGAAGSAALAASTCSSSTANRAASLNHAMKYWTDANYDNCSGEVITDNPGSSGYSHAGWNCSSGASERIVRLPDLYNGYCVWRIEKKAAGGSAWVWKQKAECSVPNANNVVTCFYSAP